MDGINRRELQDPEDIDIPNVPIDSQPQFKSTYRICYHEERRLLAELEQASAARQMQVEGALVRIRIIGWMFVYNSSLPMVTKLAEAVEDCSKKDITAYYHSLGEHLLDHWIKACE